MTNHINKGQPWTDEETARLFEMRNNGAEFHEIARKLGRSTAGIKGQWKKVNKIKNKVLIRENEELAERVRALSDAGLTEREIREELGITQSTVTYIKNVFGIKSAIAKMRERESRKIKDTICWVCKNALVNCKKPVKGWVAEKRLWGDGNPPKYTYFVKKCPNFEPEPYAPKNGGRIK